MEEFILKVRNHPCLWDMNSVFYRDVSRKTAAWEAVAQECGMCDITEAKALWKRLRDSHREAMRRRKISQISLAPWKYEEIMEFLLPQNSNVEYHNENDEASISEEEEQKMENDNTESRNVYVKVHKRDFLDTIEEREKRRIENERRRTEHRNYSVDKHRTASDEGLRDLFAGLCQKTIQLPKHLQLRVQREVFEAVTRAEEEALSYEYPGGSGYKRRGSVIETVEPQTKTIRIKNEKGKTEDMIIITE